MEHTNDKEKQNRQPGIQDSGVLVLFLVFLYSLNMPLHSLDAHITKGHGSLSYMNHPSSHTLQP